MIIYPYNQHSKSVKALKQALNIKAIKLGEGSKFKGGPKKLVINWGNSNMTEEIEKSEVLNNPNAVALASNKKKFFETVEKEVSIPKYTTDENEAYDWLMTGKKVVVREILTGNSGDGIVLLNSKEEWDDYDHSQSKMYVEYVPKKDEYRIHVSCGKVIDQQRKAMKNGLNKNLVNWQIRNLQTGFVFVRENVNPPQCVIDNALKCVELCGLDFGAVDVIYNKLHDKAYVLEVNTAPGLEGSTIDSYKDSFEVWSKNFMVDEESGHIKGFKPNFAIYDEWNLAMDIDFD